MFERVHFIQKVLVIKIFILNEITINFGLYSAPVCKSLPTNLEKMRKKVSEKPHWFISCKNHTHDYTYDYPAHYRWQAIRIVLTWEALTTKKKKKKKIGIPLVYFLMIILTSKRYAYFILYLSWRRMWISEIFLNQTALNIGILVSQVPHLQPIRCDKIRSLSLDKRISSCMKEVVWAKAMKRTFHVCKFGIER